MLSCRAAAPEQDLATCRPSRAVRAPSHAGGTASPLERQGQVMFFSTLTCVWRSSPDMEEVPQKSEGTLHLCLSLLGFARVDKGKVPHLCLACPACSPDLQEGFEGRRMLWRTYRSTGINTSAVLGAQTVVKTFAEMPWTATCLVEGTRQSSEAVSSGLPCEGCVIHDCTPPVFSCSLSFEVLEVVHPPQPGVGDSNQCPFSYRQEG